MNDNSFETITAGLEMPPIEEVVSYDEQLVEAARILQGASHDIATYHAFLKIMNDVRRRCEITEQQAYQALVLARQRLGETDV